MCFHCLSFLEFRLRSDTRRVPWSVERGLGAQWLQNHRGLSQTWTGKRWASQEFRTNPSAARWSPSASAFCLSFLHSAASLPPRMTFQSQTFAEISYLLMSQTALGLGFYTPPPLCQFNEMLSVREEQVHLIHHVQSDSNLDSPPP